MATADLWGLLSLGSTSLPWLSHAAKLSSDGSSGGAHLLPPHRFLPCLLLVAFTNLGCNPILIVSSSRLWGAGSSLFSIGSPSTSEVKVGDGMNESLWTHHEDTVFGVMGYPYFSRTMQSAVRKFSLHRTVVVNSSSTFHRKLSDCFILGSLVWLQL